MTVSRRHGSRAPRPDPLIGRSGRLTHPVSLYRFFDPYGTLLYVGVSWQPLERFKAHGRYARWWSYASSVTIEWHPREHLALDAERAAIKSEHPVFNKRSRVAA